jgi:hypothetical protein
VKEVGLEPNIVLGNLFLIIFVGNCGEKINYQNIGAGNQDAKKINFKF